MTGPRRERTATVAREIAPDVYCLGPWGRVQTDVYFVCSGSSWVLIDAGWAQDGPRIERAVESLFGADSRPAAILLTHCHPDYAGSALRLARTWGCSVYMHPAELPFATGDFAGMRAYAGPLDRGLVLPLMRVMGRRRREAVLARSSLGDVARTFEPGAGVPGLPGWECIPTPGHSPGHVSYFRPGGRVLISGDALVTLKVNSWSGLLLQRPGLSGPPWLHHVEPASSQGIGPHARPARADRAGRWPRQAHDRCRDGGSPARLRQTRPQRIVNVRGCARPMDRTA